MDNDLKIPAERLMEAVDAVLIGMEELGERSISDSPSEVLGTSRQPEMWFEFTRYEIIEAERFMRRCGLLVT